MCVIILESDRKRLTMELANREPIHKSSTESDKRWCCYYF